jgi:enamine deaminase RidA (YjgF/YER057c/UK114 family)
MTEGGKTVWLAGIIAAEDESGASLKSNFDGQVRCIFTKMAALLAQVGGSLNEVVNMTIYITNVENNGRFVELRKEFFFSDYPASTLVTVAALNRPEYLVEISAIAVLPD